MLSEGVAVRVSRRPGAANRGRSSPLGLAAVPALDACFEGAEVELEVLSLARGRDGAGGRASEAVEVLLLGLGDFDRGVAIPVHLRVRRWGPDSRCGRGADGMTHQPGPTRFDSAAVSVRAFAGVDGPALCSASHYAGS